MEAISTTNERISPDLENYVTTKQASEILTANSGKFVSPAYVRTMIRNKKLDHIKIDERTNLIPLDQVKHCVVGERGRPKKGPG